MRDAAQQADFYRQLGANIRERREQRKLSQEAVARMVGLTRTSLTNIESGRQHPPLHTFCEIVEQLGGGFAEFIPHRRQTTMAVDLQERAKRQVRGESELAFIKAAIGIEEVNPHGNTAQKNQGSGRRSLERK
jgi:transcriptional regulator with XRE-family HTH domain